MKIHQNVPLITIRDIARLCHELNRMYCEVLGDYSQPIWSFAPDWQVESTIQGVMFYLLHPSATAADGHEQWVQHKRAEGWTYGPAKDVERKHHPCLVPFCQLPEAEQRKDRLFKGVVNAFQSSDGLVLLNDPLDLKIPTNDEKTMDSNRPS